MTADRPQWIEDAGTPFALWRTVVEIDGDEATLSVWRQDDEDGFRWDVLTDVRGEIADGAAATLDGARQAAEAALRQDQDK